MSAKRSYIRVIRKQLGFQAAWVPGQILHLGEYGFIEQGAFIFQGRLTDLGGPGIEEESEAQPDANFQVTTGEKTTVTIKLAGEILENTSLPQAKAGVAFKLENDNALVCKLKGARQERIKNFAKVSDFVLKLFEEGKWDRSWRLVSERIVADGTTIVYSNSGTTVIEATANAPVEDIADASVGLSVSHFAGDEVHVVGAATLTPFVRLVRVRGYLKPDLYGANMLKEIDEFDLDDIRKGKVQLLLVEDEGEFDL